MTRDFFLLFNIYIFLIPRHVRHFWRVNLTSNSSKSEDRSDVLRGDVFAAMKPSEKRWPNLLSRYFIFSTFYLSPNDYYCTTARWRFLDHRFLSSIPRQINLSASTANFFNLIKRLFSNRIFIHSSGNGNESAIKKDITIYVYTYKRETYNSWHCFNLTSNFTLRKRKPQRFTIQRIHVFSKRLKNTDPFPLYDILL